MKRDMDLIRKILLACEQAPGGFAPQEMAFEGYTIDQIGFHVYLLADAGLMVGTEVTHSQSTGPFCVPIPLTWKGYEFLELAKDESAWSKVKGAVGAAGGMALGVLKAVLVAYITEESKRRLGLVK